MRKISATYIFPVSKKPLKNGILILDDDNRVVELIDTKGKIKEIAGLEYYSGVIVPGFVNTHCHIELSHLKGKIEKCNSLEDFISKLTKIRAADNSTIKQAIYKANELLIKNGVVAVGDISNNSLSLKTKIRSKIKYHTFVEVFTQDDKMVKKRYKKAIKIYKKFKKNNLSTSIVPHSPYTVSEKLFKKISRHSYQNNSILSIHNQESKHENELFVNKTGVLYDTLTKMGVDFSKFKITGRNSLPSILHYIPKINKTLLVHNIYTILDDLEWATDYIKYLYWVVCPSSNLFLEGRIANLEMFIEQNQKITIGTDSLASNCGLSILKEMKIISEHFPQIPFDEILKWATLNGAEALDFNKEIGSIEKGKISGINLIEGFDFKNMKINKNSTVRKVI